MSNIDINYSRDEYETVSHQKSKNTWRCIEDVDATYFFNNLFSYLLHWIYAKDKKIEINKRMLHTFIARYKYNKTFRDIASDVGYSVRTLYSKSNYFEYMLNGMIRKASDVNCGNHKISSDYFLERLSEFYANLDDNIFDLANTNYNHHVIPVLSELKDLEENGIVPRLPKGWWSDAKVSFVTYKKFMTIRNHEVSAKAQNTAI
jgi:hypothetical protein